MPTFLDALHQPHVQLLLRLVLGGLLLLAGVTKLRDRAAFREAVADYDVLLGSLERPFAAVVPGAETLLGLLLLLGLGTRVAALLAAPLFLSFAIAIGVNVWRGRSFDCHCFGSAQREGIGPVALLRSTALVLASLVVAIGASRFGALDGAFFGTDSSLPSTGEAIPIVLLAAVVFDVFFLLPETVAFQQIFRRGRAEHNHEAHS